MNNQKTQKYKNFEDIAELGDIGFSLDLKSNVLMTAHFLYENYNQPLFIKYINIYLIELGTFYELFFKYKLSQINKSLIWKNPKEYDKNKHNEAKFESIKADIAFSYAKNFGWINEAEHKLITNSKDMRNKLLHFSACEQDEDDCWRCEILKEKDIISHLRLIKRLLEDSKDSFKEALYFNLIKKEKIYMEI